MGFLDSITGADKMKDAAKAQEEGYRQGASIYQGAENNINNLYGRAPGMYNAGADNIMAMYGPDGQMNFNAIRNAPDYKFRFNEGMRAQDASGSARGMTMSGAQQKALLRYGQGMADQGIDQTLQRQYALMNAGQGGVNAMANNSQWGAGNRANMATGAAGARASGLIAEGGIRNGLFNTALSAAMAAGGGAMGGGGWAGAGQGLMGFNPGAKK